MAVRIKNLITILPILAIMVFAEVAMVSATLADDENDCADQLANMAACIPFVSGTAKKPTPECCANTQKVKSEKPKCLCVLIKESTDPSMGLPVNTTLAFQMPAICKIDASVSNCPALLNIPADSPDAKIFKEADASAGTPDSSTSPSASTPTSTSTSSTMTTPSASSSSSSESTKATPASTPSGVEKLGKSAFKIIGMALVALLLI